MRYKPKISSEEYLQKCLTLKDDIVKLIKTNDELICNLYKKLKLCNYSGCSGISGKPDLKVQDNYLFTANLELRALKYTLSKNNEYLKLITEAI